MGVCCPPHGSVSHLHVHLRGTADINNITGMQQPVGCVAPCVRLGWGWAGPGSICYLHIERLPCWPLSFGFDDGENLITLQKRTTDT